MSKFTQGTVEGPRRLMIQGLAITSSKHSSNFSEFHNTVQSVAGEDLQDASKSPAFRYAEMRKELRNNQTNTYMNKVYSNSIRNTTLVGVRPTPKSFRSSIIKHTKEKVTYTPQYSSSKRVIPKP